MESITLDSPPFCINFFKSTNNLFTGCVNSTYCIYAIDWENNKNREIKKTNLESPVYSCAGGANSLICGTQSGSIYNIDSNSLLHSWKNIVGNITAILSLEWVDANTFYSGYDDGLIEFYDIRQGNKPIYAVTECEDMISDMAYFNDQLFVCNASRLAVFDLRKNNMILHAMSDDSDYEFTSVIISEDQSKVVCGSSNGICVYNFGDYGTFKYKLGSINYSINSLIKLKQPNLFLAAGEMSEVLLCSTDTDTIYGSIGSWPQSDCTSIDSIVADEEENVVAFIDIADVIIGFADLHNMNKLISSNSKNNSKNKVDTFYADFEESS